MLKPASRDHATSHYLFSYSGYQGCVSSMAHFRWSLTPKNWKSFFLFTACVFKARYQGLRKSSSEKIFEKKDGINWLTPVKLLLRYKFYKCLQAHKAKRRFQWEAGCRIPKRRFSATVDSQYLLEAALKPCQALGRLKIKPQFFRKCIPSRSK